MPSFLQRFFQLDIILNHAVVDEDELAQVNSEMRYLTLELMKIATKRKMRFKDVLNEFIQNAYILKHAVRNSTLR